jgi:hypothetical protein
MIALSSRNNIFSQVFWIFMNAQEISSTSSANSPLYPIFFSSAHLVGSIVLKSGPA